MPFLYLTTKGWKTGKLHEIEIWYIELRGSYYVVAEMREKSHWVQNIKRDPNISFIVNKKKLEGKAKIVDPKDEPVLVGGVVQEMNKQYDWSNGTIVELRPSES